MNGRVTILDAWVWLGCKVEDLAIFVLDHLTPNEHGEVFWPTPLGALLDWWDAKWYEVFEHLNNRQYRIDTDRYARLREKASRN